MLEVIVGLCVIAAWMLGGQFGSAWRKWGIIGVLSVAIGWQILEGHVWWHYVPFIALFPELFIGYGIKSWLYKILKQEWQVRLADGLLLVWPCALVSLFQGRGLWIPIEVAVLVGAFQIHAGGFKIGQKDFLWADFLRSFALAICIGIAL
jgi:hypothetical protein